MMLFDCDGYQDVCCARCIPLRITQATAAIVDLAIDYSPCETVSQLAASM